MAMPDLKKQWPRVKPQHELEEGEQTLVVPSSNLSTNSELGIRSEQRYDSRTNTGKAARRSVRVDLLE
jgi:hypothetical protein